MQAQRRGEEVGRLLQLLPALQELAHEVEDRPVFASVDASDRASVVRPRPPCSRPLGIVDHFAEGLGGRRTLDAPRLRSPNDEVEGQAPVEVEVELRFGQPPCDGECGRVASISAAALDGLPEWRAKANALEQKQRAASAFVEGFHARVGALLSEYNAFVGTVSQKFVVWDEALAACEDEERGKLARPMP